MLNHHVVLTLLACLLSSSNANDGNDGPSVRTPQGSIRGIISARSHLGNRTVERYSGIPFAKPPLGHLRFARGELNTTKYLRELDARRLGPPCIQTPLGDPRAPGGPDRGPPPSEAKLPKPLTLTLTLTLSRPDLKDCLNLNVYRPNDAVNAPVMFWAFGGGLCGGYAGNRYNNGSALALQHGVIVVTVSYRIGALGFLTTEDVPGRGSGGENTLNLSDNDRKLNYGRHEWHP